MLTQEITDQIDVHNPITGELVGSVRVDDREEVQAAVARARAGEGPSLVENLTYRWRGHSKSDRNLYRTQAEIAEWQQRDPITRFANVLIEAGLLSRDDVEQVSQQAQDSIEAATTLALEMPEPSPENLEAEVYA